MKAPLTFGRAAVLLLAGVCPAALLSAPTTVRAQPPGFAYPPAPTLSSVNAAAAASEEPPLANPGQPAATTAAPPAVSAGPCCGAPLYPIPGCPSPYGPPSVTQPGQPTPENPMGGGQPPAQEPGVNPGSEASGARGGENTAIAAPNVLGDLLNLSRSIRVPALNGVQDNQSIFRSGGTRVVNAAVDENNSPLPEDRVYFRYNFYSNPESVTGLSTAPNPNYPFSTIPLETKSYNVNMYTFGGEKTFLDGLLSVEMRVPISTGLASHNTLSEGSVASAMPPGSQLVGNTAFLQTFSTISTPQDTLGQQDTEFGNMTLVFKGLFYRDRNAGLFASAGMAATLPTGQNTSLGVVDFLYDTQTPGSPLAAAQRRESILVENSTSSLTPFLAALWTPSDRVFTQGFLALEIPVGSSRVTYNDQFYGFLPGTSTLRQINPVTGGFSTNGTPINNYTARISEQPLAHLDWNIGWWAYRAPDDRWLTGIAPCFEVHYTTTLNTAEAVYLPSDGIFTGTTTGGVTTQSGPIVGGQPSTMNIVDLTAGSTFVLGKNTTVATGFSFPITNQTNRTFDWEFQLQLNYYFGR